MKFLIVDDYECDIILVKETLKKHFNGSTEYHIANNGEDAIEIFKKINPDITITDISMPNMSGYELCRKLIKINPKAIVILMTGSVYLIDNELAENCGAHCFVTKAHHYLELEVEVRNIMSQAEIILKGKK